MMIVTPQILRYEEIRRHGDVGHSGSQDTTLNVDRHLRGGGGTVETTRRESQVTDATAVTTGTAGRPERGGEAEAVAGKTGTAGGSEEIKGAVPDGNKTHPATPFLIMHTLLC